MSVTLTVNHAEVQQALRNLAQRQVPYALSLAINATAKDILVREHAEIQRVFDRPTPKVAKGLRVIHWAKKQDGAAMSAIIGFKDYYRDSMMIEQALKPHIPQFPIERALKRSEWWLTAQGMMSPTERLVPSRTMPRDQYGNVRGPTMKKMISDVGGYRGASGFDSTTRARKARYVWGTVPGRRGGMVRGIWLVEGGARNAERGRWSLMMLVVSRARYRKRFDFKRIAEETRNARFPINMQHAIAKATRSAR